MNKLVIIEHVETLASRGKDRGNFYIYSDLLPSFDFSLN